MKTKRPISFWANLLEALIIGVLVGVLVGLYQLGMTYVLKGSRFMYQSSNPWIITAMVIAIIVLSIINFFLIKRHKGIAGSGVPAIEICIHDEKPTDWKSELPLMIANSYVSSFAGFPLGSEGPSVVIGGKTAQMVEDVGNVGEEDTIAMACGTGFGCAYLCPIAGLSYMFEESLHKFDFKLLLRGIIMQFSAILVSSLINHHRLLDVENVVLIPFRNYYVFALLIIINVLMGIAFVKGMMTAKKLFKQQENNPIIKNWGFVMFGLVMILNFLCLDYMGSGTNIIGSIASFDSLWILGGLILFRFVLTTLAGTGKVTGGIVIPMMSFGALTGQIICNICNNYFGMPTDSNGVIVLISICMVFGVVTQTPITATALVYSSLAYSDGSHLSVLPIVPMTAVAMFLACHIAKLLGSRDIYQLMIEMEVGHHIDYAEPQSFSEPVTETPQ